MILNGEHLINRGASETNKLQTIIDKRNSRRCQSIRGEEHVLE